MFERFARLSETASGRSLALIPAAGKTVLEAALVVASGILMARLVWLLVAPADAIGTAPAGLPPVADQGSPSMAQVNLDILTQYNAFNPEATAPDLFAGAAETSLNLRLAGIRAADGDEGGAGIVILADGTQRRVATGEEFMPGVVMHSVTPDRAILRHSGRYETLSLSSSSPSLIAPERSGPPGGTAAPMAFSASQVFQDTEFRPESRGGQLAGYTLSPRTNLGAFRAGGLEAGDLVVRVNGQPVQELGPDTLAAALTASPDAIMLDVIRGGASLRLQVPPEGNSG